MNRFTALKLGAALAALVTTGCVLLTAEQLQQLKLFLQSAEELPAGEFTEVHSTVYAREFTVKGSFVKLFGRITAPEGGELPGSAVVRVLSADIATERVYNKLNFNLRIQADGTFAAVKKLRRDFSAETLQTILVKPNGKPIPEGTRLALCVEVAKSKADTSPTDSCAPSEPGNGGGGGGGGGSVVRIQVLDNRFEPKSPIIQAGDTVQWTLIGSNRNHTATALDGTWDSGLAFQVAEATFERTFPLAEDGMTFEYVCTTHRNCCAMQGSIRVGENAPPPAEGF